MTRMNGNSAVHAIGNSLEKTSGLAATRDVVTSNYAGIAINVRRIT